MQVVLKLIWILGVAVAGLFPSAASADPILVIDATADPGVGLLVTFVPQSSVVGGVRRVAAQQSVVTKAVLRLGATLPTYWMVSVWRKGDVAANVATRSVSDGAGYMNFVFPNEMDVILDNGEWQIPHFDSNLYLVAVGFGIGDAVIYPAYTVNCRPGQQIKMAPGNYQMVRSDGDDALGTTIKPDLETWDIPSTSDSILTFNAKGEGTLRPLH